MADTAKYEHEHDSAMMLEKLMPTPSVSVCKLASEDGLATAKERLPGALSDFLEGLPDDLLARALAKVQLYVNEGIGKDLLLVYVGFALLRHGPQFKRLVLFTQVVSACFSGCVKSSIMTVWQSAAAHKFSAGAEETWKDKARRARVVLRSLDKADIFIAVFHTLLMLAAGILAVSEGSAQKLAVSGFLAEVLAEKTVVALDLLACKHQRLRVQLVVYAAALVLATLSAPLALLLNVLVCGAHVVSRHGLRLAEVAGFVEDPEVISVFDLRAVLVLVPLGAVSQLWAWAFGSGVALHLRLLYLPANLAESCLEVF